MNFLLIYVLLAAILPAQAPARVPSGYRAPVESDFTANWLEHRAELPTPFHVRADFNGDSTTDDAWILLAEDGTGFGLFINLAKEAGEGAWLKLDDGAYAQAVALHVVRPGTYATACAKGYGPGCRSDEAKLLRLSRPGIELQEFERGASYFWWNSNSGQFERTRISD